MLQTPTRPLSVSGVAVYRGPNLFSRLPMIRIDLDLGTLEEFPTSRLPGFAEALVQTLPRLADHGCSIGAAGGFLERLSAGTWLGHVIEHVAIELQVRAGYRVSRGKTRSVKGRPGVYHVLFAYGDEEAGRLAGRLAIELVDGLLPVALRGARGLERVAPERHGITSVDDAIAAIRSVKAEIGLGPSTAALVAEAERRGIPWRRLSADGIIQLGQGARQVRLAGALGSTTSQLAVDIASNKELTRRLLREAGISAPEGRTVTGPADAKAAARDLGWPVVVKPLDANHGRGVTVAVASATELDWAYEQARTHSPHVIVEQYFSGTDHRLLVVGGRLVAAAERHPAAVTGDGRQTIRALVAAINADPERGAGHEALLTRITLDECAGHMLARQGMTPDSVPAPGQVVVLRPTANLSTGGYAIDCTDRVHPEIADMAIRAARIIGLDIAGIDFVSPDISRSPFEVGGGIIEVNAAPGLRMHLAPRSGKPRDVAGPILDLLFPEGRDGRIPVFAVTGTNGKTTTGTMLAHILMAAGYRVGQSSTNGVYVDGRRRFKADASGPQSARALLSDPEVEAVVLETARGGILREGLGFAEADVATVLNIAADHLGLGGIDTLDDLAQVKGIVVEAVRPAGTSVLNADDPHSVALRGIAGGHIAWFSLRPRRDWPRWLEQHADAGGLVAALDDAEGIPTLTLHQGQRRRPLIAAARIPATVNGAARFNIANALAAALMAFAGGVTPATIRRALAQFDCTFDQSPGRLNRIMLGGAEVILDYAHNPHGLAALGETLSALAPAARRRIGVIGVAGDRRDPDIRDMGALAGQMFDLVIVKEDDDLRGRRPGEVAALLREGALSTGIAPDCVLTVLDERDAICRSFDLLRAGDLVLVTADDIERAWALLSTRAADLASAAVLVPG